MSFHYHQRLCCRQIIDSKEGIGHGFSPEQLWYCTLCAIYVVAFNDVVP